MGAARVTPVQLVPSRPSQTRQDRRAGGAPQAASRGLAPGGRRAPRANGPDAEAVPRGSGPLKQAVFPFPFFLFNDGSFSIFIGRSLIAPGLSDWMGDALTFIEINTLINHEVHNV